MKKKLLILGSTGSIGKNTLDVIKKNKDRFEIIGLSTNKNINLLARQIEEFKPKNVCITDSYMADLFKRRYNKKLKFYTGIEGLIEIIENLTPDLVLIGISGSIAIHPLLACIRKNLKIALANKESLVMAGEFVRNELKKYNAEIIPVDSEHSAIFQCIHNREKNEINSITLTASGGALFNKKISKITKELVLKHPQWKMGKKITVDSATLMNKGLELFEAHYLFDISFKKIKILIHPQSIIHAMIEFVDGSILTLMSTPDMRLPIQYALTYPQRIKSQVKPLNLIGKKLEFYEPDLNKFPCLKLAIETTKILGTAPAVLNATNEESVNAFLRDEIDFNQIPKIIERILDNHKVIKNPSLEDIFYADNWARNKSRELICSLRS